MISDILEGDEIEYLDEGGIRRWATAIQASHTGVVSVYSLADASVRFSIQAARIVAVHRVIVGQGTVTMASMNATIEGGSLTLRWIEEGSGEHVKKFSPEETASLLSLLYASRSEILEAYHKE